MAAAHRTFSSVVVLCSSVLQTLQSLYLESNWEDKSRLGGHLTATSALICFAFQFWWPNPRKQRIGGLHPWPPSVTLLFFPQDLWISQTIWIVYHTRCSFTSLFWPWGVLISLSLPRKSGRKSISLFIAQKSEWSDFISFHLPPVWVLPLHAGTGTMFYTLRTSLYLKCMDRIYPLTLW